MSGKDEEEKKDRHSNDPKSSVKAPPKKDGAGGKYTMGKPEDQDGPAVLDKGDPNYDSEAEEAEEAEEAAKPKEEEKEKKPVEYEGAAAGKYKWDDAKTVDVELGEAITKYGWSDGKKRVSVYIELDGLDDVADDALAVESDEKSVTLTIASIGGKKKRFAAAGLFAEIEGVKLERKKGKNTVVLKLQKKEEKTWFKLLEASSGKAGGDDEDDPAGGMGGMGGMDMASMMGGMGGGMGGMDMASMMGGMGGMMDGPACLRQELHSAAG
eukprot:CAMPEP_0204586586 /NCGR_PEP_ID=MMETSP0661-20131031/47577_1 /ASSEMBLY_ACC=CAM_ASM_000606 /TAXON_ID=109239 /ORGANISM="Alexandrium margalefi, Strain AMGDE01CS-322" /LENGTH=267 /DNA_ID=CAMNT_0051596237 /DNA_START=67 /DNA_END=868 /DNA_ORIENTATION=+